ncbi:hypothetical protein M758_4G256800, partial [Ceratodon purpureus]
CPGRQRRLGLRSVGSVCGVGKKRCCCCSRRELHWGCRDLLGFFRGQLGAWWSCCGFGNVSDERCMCWGELLGFLGRLVFFVRYFILCLCRRIYGDHDCQLELRKC